jgi:hypothetical protein
MEQIRDSITLLRKELPGSRYYVPEVKLQSVLSKAAIYQVLQQCSNVQPQELTELTKLVDDGARKILGILLIIGHVGYIKTFISEDQFQQSQLDHRLPFELQKLEALLRPAHARLFFDRQWEFISPVFSESVLRRQLDDHIILPFTDDSYRDKGGFGMVYNIQLEPEQNLYGSNFQQVRSTTTNELL